MQFHQGTSQSMGDESHTTDGKLGAARARCVCYLLVILQWSHWVPYGAILTKGMQAPSVETSVAGKFQASFQIIFVCWTKFSLGRQNLASRAVVYDFLINWDMPLLKEWGKGVFGDSFLLWKVHRTYDRSQNNISQLLSPPSPHCKFPSFS